MMTTQRRTTRIAATAFVLAASLSGCGSSDDDAAATSSAASSSTSTVSESEESEESPTESSAASSSEASNSGTDGAWTYGESNDSDTALTTGPGSSLEFLDEGYSGTAYLRAEEFTWDAIQTDICPTTASGFGCGDVEIAASAGNLTVKGTVPESPNDPKISLSGPKDIWELVASSTGTFTVTITADDDTQIVFEFTADGADPEFFD